MKMLLRKIKKQIMEYYNIIKQLYDLISEKEIEANEYGKEYFKNSIN